MSDWISDTVKTNGVTLHYHRTDGDKPPLVLSHGITDNGLCWRRVAQVLQQDYDLIMVDARGHGESDKPESGYLPEDRAADLAGLIEALGLEKPYLLGHSMGAETTATVAARYPDLPGCAILEDPPWRDEATALSPAARAARAEEWRHNTLARREQSLAEIIAAGRRTNPTWDDSEFEAWAQSKRQVSPNVFQTVSRQRADWRTYLDRTTCPTLLLTGDVEAGAIVSPALAEEVAARWPQVSVIHIPGAGHNIRREQFETYMAAVTNFLNDLPTG